MSEKPWIEIISDKHFSDASKTRPESSASLEKCPTPWEVISSYEDAEIVDANGDSIHAYIALPVIVHRVNNFDSLLEACRAILNSSDYSDDDRPLMRNLRNAVESAEKQP